MVRKSNSRKAGIGGGRGVKRHKVRSAADDSDESFLEAIITAVISRKKLQNIAQQCFIYMSRACSQLHLFPFEVLGMKINELEFKPSTSWRRKYTHRALIAVWALTLSWRFCETTKRLVRKELDLFTYMSICYVLISGATFVGAAGTTVCADHMVTLFRSGHPLLRSISEITGKYDMPRSSFPYKPHICLKMILATIVAHVTCINASFISLAFDTLPVCLFPIMRDLGILSADSMIQSIGWRVLLYPLELMTLLPGMFLTMYNVMLLVLTTECIQTALEMTGKVSVTDGDTWRRLERSYRYVKLYERQANNTFWHFLGPVIFLACSATVVLLYVTVRPSGLPFIIHCWFPLAAVLILIALMWICFDLIVIRRLAEDIVDKLGRKCRLGSGGIVISPRLRAELKRRSQSLRIVHLIVGSFGQMTLLVMVAMWEEILNQLLFLLSM